MSHKATYWLATVPPATITAGAFRVLFHLCDHHNDERAPELACFPSQDRLMEKTGLSNGGLNKCLNALESAGLLERKRGTSPGTSERRTYYILGCDGVENPMQTPQSGDSPNSTPVETAPKLTPLLDIANSTFEHSKLHPSGDYPVRNLKEPYVCDAHTHFEDFWKVYPRPKDRDETKELFAAAVNAGADPAHIAFSAKKYAAENEGNTQYCKHSTSWLEKESWRDFDPPAPVADIRTQLINAMNSPVPAVREDAEKKWRNKFPTENLPMEAAE